MRDNKAPADEDFARARAAMRRRDWGLSAVRTTVLDRFREVGVHEFFIFYSPNSASFIAHIFLETDRKRAELEGSDWRLHIEDLVLEELVKEGRGTREDLVVQFEFDSHENVLLNYGGDYFLRLR